MLQAALRSGTAHRRSVFELFPRRLPEGRRYGVVAGVGRALDAIERFRFDDAALAVLADVVDGPTLEWLASYRFSGDVWGYAEGEAYFPYSPLLVVESTFAEAVLLETLLLSIYNHDSAIASAASRMTLAAGDRPCIEMGSRRTHEEAAVAAARAAYVAGFATSSNLAARERYGVPTTGTSAHSFTLLHDTEEEAFRAQVASLGTGHDAARRHLRRRGGGAAGGRGGGHRARRRTPRLRRPRRARGAGARPARRARRDRDADHRDQRPRRVRDRVAGRRAGRRVRRRHRSSSPGAGTRRAASSTSWSRARPASGELVSVAKKSVDKVSVGGRKYALRRRSAAGCRRGRGDRDRRRAGRRRRRPVAAGAAGAGRRGGRPGAARRTPAPGTSRRAPSCRSRSSRCRAASR